ncbi:glycosyltransferase family 10 [Helicobacter sp. MIT 21-1697]|uniref:glycosyltransferase family 10 domain-containing protein n=1 Tax=Helicobacter sp. MIT 21-1697 TaxID=2993733 RepID=UPI00224B769A|nr:glycosyltransferase family 10 [Helicobacter sp. MIT 21-1697]MCX2717440.1 glycosyltransferase family 10 [Helicobacter sp. MIT 21-1697]
MGGGAKYALFSESESIIPDDYRIFDTQKGIHKDFKAVFTYSEKLLNELENAKFIPAAGLWYGQEKGCNIALDDKVYQIKDKNVSMMCSNKIFCEMHKIRHSIAQKALQSQKVDVFGKFNGGVFLPHKADSLQKYRFQIVVENDCTAYYFTEKILDCFAAQCIPIYLGAREIHQFFNNEGIITFTPKTPLEEILKICNEKEYLTRLEAVLDNYQRVLKYQKGSDLFYEEYFTDKPKHFAGIR